MGRAPCCDKANVKKGPWSPEEDAKLKAYIDNYGTGGNWIALPQKIGLKRCGKSCRLRWLNYLRPNIKHGGFTEEEDNIICSLYISIGSRWSIIAAQLPGRTDNDIKNYWNTRLKKKLLGRRKQNRLANSKDGDHHQETSYNNNNNLQNELSSSAIERLQLHVQLQTLHNNDPFSFYNNPSLCPKLNPLQHKMIQTLHSQYQLNNQSHQNIDHLIMHQNVHESPSIHQHDHYPRGFKTESSFAPMMSTKQVCTNGIDQGPDMKMMVANSGFTAQLAELEDLINSKSSGFLSSAENYNNNNEQVAEFDCFKEMDGSKDINVDLAWWPNEFHDVNSTSSNSWDNSAGTTLVREEMYQDFGTMDYSTRSEIYGRSVL